MHEPDSAVEPTAGNSLAAEMRRRTEQKFNFSYPHDGRVSLSYRLERETDVFLYLFLAVLGSLGFVYWHNHLGSGDEVPQTKTTSQKTIFLKVINESRTTDSFLGHANGRRIAGLFSNRTFVTKAGDFYVNTMGETRWELLLSYFDPDGRRKAI